MAELLSAARMIGELGAHGEDAGSDYNDGEDIDGYFGWSVSGDVLTVTHQLDYPDGDGPTVTRRWRLVEITED